MNIIKTLELKQTLHSIQAEAWLHMLKDCSRTAYTLSQSIKRNIDAQLDRALAVGVEIEIKHKELLQYNKALLVAMQADPSETTPVHFCWVKRL